MADPPDQIDLAHLDTMMRFAPLSMAFWDRDLRFVRINEVAASIDGISVEEHIGRTFREVVGDDVADQAESVLRRVLETGEPVVGLDVHATWASGEVRQFDASFYPVELDGERIGVGSVGVDVTLVRRSERLRERDATERAAVADARTRAADIALSEAHDAGEAAGRRGAEYERALRDYRQLIRHRMANPLQVICGMSRTLLEREELDTETSRGMLEHILEQANRLERIALDPVTLTVEEAELRPRPRGT